VIAARHVVSATLVVVGIIHVLPASGILGAERIASLYGISVDDPNLLLLMRHRAMLFGLLGIFLISAAFKPAYQLAALMAGFVSVVSFLWLAWPISAYNAQIYRVFSADVVALACLIVGFAAYLHGRRGR